MLQDILYGGTAHVIALAIFIAIAIVAGVFAAWTSCHDDHGLRFTAKAR